ncbi:MAG TPA: pentapeptide repeat-containing protein [Mycobacteriales bacterium]|nr:pentapeptide repeat-containing protein [Mycobacteriales bacterium]
MADQLDPVGPQRVRLRPLRWWWVAAAAVLVVIAGMSVGWVLWSQGRGLIGSALPQARADSIRTGLAAAAGTGAALALLLAVRRQRSTEIALDLQVDDLVQKEQIASVSAHDATERRITDLYAKAVEQLGSDKALARLGGLHALERLAHDNVTHRQTIVDVLCAYLRMPYTPNTRRISRSVPDLLSTEVSPDASDSPAQNSDGRDFGRCEQEHQVRQTAQRILARHLQPFRDTKGQPSNPKFWPAIDVDLTGACLVDFAMNQCEVHTITCNNTTFAGETLFRAFVRDLAFVQAATFVGGPAEDTFTADFRGAHFGSGAWFSYTTFAGDPWFNADEFFPGAHFGQYASFKGTTFHRGARFDGALFEKDVDFTDARTRSDPGSDQDWPRNWMESPETDPMDGPSDNRTTRWNRLIAADE